MPAVCHSRPRHRAEPRLPGYFEAMHTLLIAGQTFTEADNTPDRNMLIVNQTRASKAFPFQSAVGKRILFRSGSMG